MKRRIILSLIIISILGGLATGAWWYLRQTSGPKLLARAELAIRAQRFNKALNLAERYATKYPDDWRGHYVKAKALLSLGRESDVRATLAEAGRLAPSEISVPIALAESYSVPARRSLTGKDTVGKPGLVSEAIKQLNRANNILLGTMPSDAKSASELGQHIGLNHHRNAVALRAAAENLAKEAKIAEASGAGQLAAAKRKDAEAASVGSDEAADQAIKMLLNAVREDPSRPRPARALVELCIQRGDEESLAAASKEIMALKSPPPVAAMKLALHDLDPEADAAARGEQLGKLCQLLDDLLKEHPDEVEIKLARAAAAVRLGDSARAEQLCNEVLQANPWQGQARFIRARVLMQQGNTAEAERILFGLKTDYSGWRDAHLAYAQAALATGKKELAREAMRTVTELDPDHAIARRYLTRSLLEEGFYDQAFADAQEYYRAHPEDPAAIRLFAEAAIRSDQPELAKTAVEKASADYPAVPEMLMAVAEGYELLGERVKVRQALLKAADCGFTTATSRLAVARAMMEIDRTGEAEKLLSDELARTPNHPGVHFQLGRLYADSGRILQAIEQFHAAVRVAGQNVDYCLALAEALLASGDLEQCQSVLEKIDATNAEANLLRLQLKLLEGEDVPVEQTLQQVRGAKVTGMWQAMIYLRNDRPEQCVQVCLAGLEKTPDDFRLRFLLGQAYLVQGQKDESLEQFSAALKAAPWWWQPTYQCIAGVLSEGLSPRQVERALAAIPGARQGMIDLTMGWLFVRLGDLDSAAEAYGRLAGRREAPEFLRNRARLLCARVLAAKGYLDRAAVELDELAETQAWQARAMAEKVSILIRANRRKEAMELLGPLRNIASETRDGAGLRRIAEQYVRMNQIESALTVCDQLEALFPNDASSYLVRAATLASDRRAREAFPLLRKAIKLQPGNFRTYVTLATALDAEQQPHEALAALKLMEKQGQTGQVTALFEQGLLFARWGLYAQSIECFQQLATQGYTGVPRLQLAMGQTLAGVGQKDRARELLESVSVYSPQYVTAQQLVAELAETDDERLAILSRLGKAKPGDVRVLIKKMEVLLRVDQPAEAVKAFRSFSGRLAQDKPRPPRASYLALQAMLAANDQESASELAARIAEQPGAARWRYLAILLSLDNQPSYAAKMLPSVDKADPYDAILGLILSVQKDDAASSQKWADRIDQIGRDLAQMRKPRTISLRYKLLVALAAGRLSRAKAELTGFRTDHNIDRDAAVELVTCADEQANVAAEAAKLLKASMAIDLGLAELGKSWAMKVLRARPRCQWAATLVFQAQPDIATQKEVVGILRPEDCSLIRTVRASVLMHEKKYEEAAEVYRQVAEVEEDDPQLVLNQAGAAESGGKLDEALALYLKVWETRRDPVAANNAASIVSQLYPKDMARLTEALQWVGAALEAAPQSAYFRDTKGWISFLLGQKEQARLEVRRAIKGLPRAPEVHYHLGVIETDAGNADLSRWHLEAAVSTAEVIKARGEELTITEAKSARLANEALAKMDGRKE